MNRTAHLIDHEHRATVEVEVLRDDDFCFLVKVTALPKRMRPFYMEDETTGKTLSVAPELLVFHDAFPVCDDAGNSPAEDEARRRMAMKIGTDELNA